MKNQFLRRLPCRLSTPSSMSARFQGDTGMLFWPSQKLSGNCRCVCVRGIRICRRLIARLTCFRLVDVMAFRGDTGGSVWPVNMTIERERNRNTLSIQELDFQHQPCDFFARIVMVLLHNLCPDSRIHSSDEGRSWALPLRWIEQHLGLPEQPTLTAPQSVLKTPVGEGAFDSLLLQLLSGGSGAELYEDWNARAGGIPSVRTEAGRGKI